MGLRHRRWVGGVTITALCAALAPAHADEPTPPAPGRDGPRVTKALAATRAPGPIAVDGVLDEPAWAAAVPITDLVQKIPDYGRPGRHPTEIRVVFDDEALYVGARMWDAPGATRAVVTRRDQTRDAERFIVSFDPYRSGRQAYSFAVTVAGVRADWIHTDDTEGARDLSWDPVWSAATRVLPDGWSAELRLPWTQLRYPAGSAAPWGVNFNRYIPDRNEDIFWIAVPRERTAWSSYMGELRGLSGLPRRAGVELFPYAAAALDLPADGDAVPDARIGLDARLGVGAGLTADLTLNPDFGQVEADPAIVNLTAFEVSLPERRPFFVAGNESFASAPRGYFYSRRIGAGTDRILAAAKLSGRLGHRTAMGALAAVTDDGARDGGLGGWSAARVERELGPSRLGVTAAMVGRDATAASLAPRASALAGVDGVHRWDDGAWEAVGLAGVSGLWGDAAVVERVQRASARYFQRPDAAHVELDPARTSLTGWHGHARVGRRAGSLRGQVGVDATSPGHDTNGTGLLTRADELATNASAFWHDTTPSARWLDWQVGATTGATWTFGGERRGAYVDAGAAGSTSGFTRVEVGGGVDLGGQSDSLTRGGPLVASPVGGYGWAGVSSQSSSVVTWSGNAHGHHAPRGTSAGTVAGSVSVRPDPRLRLELTPRASLVRDRQAYVATVDGGPAATFGQRYVLATLDQRELATVARVELTLTPELAIDLYAESFIATGAYRDLAELRAAGSGDLRRYDRVTRAGTTVTIDDGAGFTLPEPDFTARSFRSTAVVRWEPRPGRTLYAVWQQARGDGEPRARALGPGLLDAATAPASHTFALKLTWWFAR